jgi:hypothetical protein
MGVNTHNIPKLIATHTPIFSAVRICKFQSIFHGRIARDTSMSADQTVSYVSQEIKVHSLGLCAHWLEIARTRQKVACCHKYLV